MDDPVIDRWIGHLDDELFPNALSSMSRFYGLEVKLLRREDDRTPFIICRYVKNSFEKEVLFLLSVGRTRLVGGPATDLDIAIAEPAANTSRWGLTFLGLDFWCRVRLLRGFDMLPATNM